MNTPFHEKPGISPSNRSLERGIEILRAFRPGSNLLGNGELAERTGLSRSTVSRLTQTLVGTGLLELDASTRTYRLHAAVLSLGHAMRSASLVLQKAAPLMKAVAETHRVNVGLAVADRDEMVYLESIRYNRRIALRNVVSGQRVPIELTSLGYAYLATASDARRKLLFGVFKARRGPEWPALRREIEAAIGHVRAHGWCMASWQPEVVALATPIVVDRVPVHALNMSVSSAEDPASVARELKGKLLRLGAAISKAIETA
ncbi:MULTISPECIES: IclR family transcriptional regulator [unclassified Variovorax]|uniref:IclR family transcriptional regulator n=1 Tax=unclassified Variovorax TaxID=663243 RepID=UPI0013169201|nr:MULTISPECIES: IclR family transcriptional regulator [unclassified Variovorax]VTU28362.1 Pca regulon regulatory protein [Variovorax sp. SRS16]VTU35967.1 Pca regulon regulatory protein [Variovorax sp. PBL-E5]